MKVLLLQLLLIVFISACASRKDHRPLFPYGIYHHRVELVMKDKAMSFRGINLWSKDKLSLLALGDFDVTLLKYQEDFKSGHKEIYVHDLLPLTGDQAKKYLSVVRSVYSLDHSICQERLCRTSFFGQEIQLNLNEKDEVSLITFERQGLQVRVLKDQTEDQNGKKLNH